VDVSGDAATSVVVDNPNQITCTFPSKASPVAGIVTVTKPAPHSSTPTFHFNYFAPTWDPTTGRLTGPVTDVEIGLDAQAGDMICALKLWPAAGSFLPCSLKDGSGSAMPLVETGLSAGWMNLECRPIQMSSLMRSTDGAWKITLGSSQGFMCLYFSRKLEGG
jgi:hypothetical protein